MNKREKKKIGNWEKIKKKSEKEKAKQKKNAAICERVLWNEGYEKGIGYKDPKESRQQKMTRKKRG